MISEETRRQKVLAFDYYGRKVWRYGTLRGFVHIGCGTFHRSKKVAQRCAEKMAQKETLFG